MQDSRRSPVRSPTFVPSPRSALGQPSREMPTGYPKSPVSFGRPSFGPQGLRSPSFGRQGVRSPSFGQEGIGSSYSDRERFPAPTYDFVAESRSEPRYAMISFESSDKSTATNTYSATYQLSDADPLPEATEKFRLMGSADSDKSSGLASSASPSGSSVLSSTGAEGAYGPLPRRKIAMGIFSLVSASAIAITLLVQGSLQRGDEGHVGTGTDPPLRLEKGSDLSADSVGFAMHFARRPTTESTKTTPKQPPFLIVSLRPRTTTPSTEGPFTWPPFPETYPPWDFQDDTSTSKNSSAETDGPLNATNFEAAAVFLEQQQLMDEAPVTALDGTFQDEQER